LTVTDKQTIRKKLYKSQKYTHKHNTNQRKQTTKHTAENKTTLIQSPLTTQPGNEVGLFYNGPEHHIDLDVHFHYEYRVGMRLPMVTMSLTRIGLMLYSAVLAHVNLVQLTTFRYEMLN